jgi:hypothetical protein
MNLEKLTEGELFSAILRRPSDPRSVAEDLKIITHRPRALQGAIGESGEAERERDPEQLGEPTRHP